MSKETASKEIKSIDYKLLERILYVTDYGYSPQTAASIPSTVYIYDGEDKEHARA